MLLARCIATKKLLRSEKNMALSSDPTNHFTILKPQDQEIGECYVVQQHRATDFEASNL